MGNRIIKESVCVSEQIDELDWFEEVFFYRLLVNCDDFGVMDARPKILKARLFPLKEVKLQTIQTALETMVRIGLIQMYEAEGKPFLQVIKWAEHQRVRDSKHKYPTPEEADSGETRQVAASCGESRQVAASCGEVQQDAADCGSRAQPRAGAESESESISESESKVSTRARARESDPAFDAFWSEYPNKANKPRARKEWDRLKPEAELVAQIMQGLARWKQSDQWTRDDGRFIQHPATWLHGRQWEDEVHQRRMIRTVTAQEYGQRDYSGVQDELMARQDAEMEAYMAAENAKKGTA